MDKINKFLAKLDKKRRLLLINEILPKIRDLNLVNFDLTPLGGFKNLYRIRVGKMRIVFYKDEKNKTGIIVNIKFRKDAYKYL